jgi:hypothetical protein
MKHQNSERKNAFEAQIRQRKGKTSADIQLEFGFGKGKFIQFLFLIVAKSLYMLAVKLKLSYSQINILVYFFVVPFVYLALIDRILGFHFLKIAALLGSIGFFVLCRDFSAFSDQLFSQSVRFLRYFDRFGMGLRKCFYLDLCGVTRFAPFWIDSHDLLILHSLDRSSLQPCKLAENYFFSQCPPTLSKKKRHEKTILQTKRNLVYRLTRIFRARFGYTR